MSLLSAIISVARSLTSSKRTAPRKRKHGRESEITCTANSSLNTHAALITTTAIASTESKYLQSDSLNCESIHFSDLKSATQITVNYNNCTDIDLPTSCLTDNRSIRAPVHIPVVSSCTGPLTPVILSTSNDIDTAMLRKVWVKRPGASATRVEVDEDDLVDNVRDVILRKYANSLGRSIDSPDVTLKIISRERSNNNVPPERVLSPEEPISRTLDTYYPGGQGIDEALIIEVPHKRTPRASPRPGNHLHYYGHEEYRPGDGARDYFGPIPLQSPHLGHVQHQTLANGVQLPIHSMSVLTTGQVPPLPSPGARRQPRPRYGRQHTSSPTIMHSAQPQHPNGVGRWYQ